MKNHELYPLYISYLDNKKINKGQYELYKISESAFNDFKIKYEKNINFRIKQDSLFKKTVRDLKIDNIVDNL